MVGTYTLSLCAIKGESSHIKTNYNELVSPEKCKCVCVGKSINDYTFIQRGI